MSDLEDDSFHEDELEDDLSQEDELEDHPSWRDGNFELISYDNVFSDMYSIGSGEAKAHLVSEGETSDVVAKFLDLISRGYHDFDKTLTGIPPLAKFLNKWDCPASIASLLAQIQVGVLLGELSPIHSFIIAAELDDEKTATVALRQGDWTWKQPGSGVTNRNVFDPRGWPAAVWREAMLTSNPDYFFALARAYDEVKASPPPVTVPDASATAKPLDFPGAFSKYLTMAKEGKDG